MAQCSEDVKDINQRLDRVEHDIAQIKTAFLRNDLGAEDYDGHRNDHRVRVKQAEKKAEAMDEFTQSVTKRIIFGAIGLAFTIFGYGLLPYLRSLVAGG